MILVFARSLCLNLMITMMSSSKSKRIFLKGYKFKNKLLVCMLAADQSGRRFCMFGFARKYNGFAHKNMALPLNIWFCCLTFSLVLCINKSKFSLFIRNTFIRDTSLSYETRKQPRPKYHVNIYFGKHPETVFFYFSPW